MYKPKFDMGVFKKTLVKESLKRKFSLDALDKIVELMRSVICNSSSQCTGYAYFMKDFDLIGKNYFEKILFEG